MSLYPWEDSTDYPKSAECVDCEGRVFEDDVKKCPFCADPICRTCLEENGCCGSCDEEEF